MSDYVIIPAYNEGQRIIYVLKKAKEFTPNVIVVDDGSKDETYSYAQRAGAIMLKHEVNLGKGAALKTGCDFALSKGAAKLIVLDADGQHEPEEIPNFLKALNGHDLVYSYRKAPKSMPFVLRFGNWFINKTLNVLYHTDIKDSQCGYRAFTSEAYRKIRWGSRDYFVETEMIMKACQNRLKYAQIPIETIYADKYKGTTVLDGVKVVLKILGGKY